MPDAVVIESDYISVRSALVRALDQIGGMARFVESGMNVLLKPNLALPLSPSRAATTHPAVVAAVAEMVCEVGAYPVIADSPMSHIAFVPKVMEDLYQATGMDKVTAARLNFDIGASTMEGWEVLRVLSEVDAVISLPKLKTHVLTGLTGAMKNMLGIIPGNRKAGLHALSQTAFQDVFLDLDRLVRPRLTVMDAIDAMQGNGPAAGDSAHLGRLIVSESALAVDTVAAGMVGMPDIPVISRARERGLIPKVREIRLDTAERVSFRPPHHLLYRFPAIIRTAARILDARWVLQVPQPTARCIGCGACRDICPTGSIEIVDQQARISLKQCQRCYCCVEACVHGALVLRWPRAVGRIMERLWVRA